jgi:hypothetical protein
MSIKQCLYLFNTGHSTKEIVKQMELTEADARVIAIKVISWLDGLQLESRHQEQYRR